MCTPMPPSHGGSLPSMDPYGKVVRAMLKPATLVLMGLASAAAIAHAFRAPFPGPGGNPVLDLIAYHDPGFHTVIRVWYYVAPTVAVVLFGSLGLSVWRVWLQPRAGGGRRGTLPPWPASPEDETPSLVIGELHHPVVPRESERPSWLVVPETGLYTGVLIVGAVGSGKTTACMYPFAQQLLSWQADRPARRASARTPNSPGAACTLIARGLVAEEPCPAFGGSDEFAASMPGASCRALAEGIRHRRDASPAVLMRRLFSLDYLMEHATCLGFAPRARCEGRPKPGPPGRVSTSKRLMRRVEPERPRLRRTGLSAAPKAGEPAYPLGPRFAGPRQGLAGGCAPSDPPNGNGTSWALDATCG